MTRKKIRAAHATTTPPTGTVTQVSHILEKAMASWAAALRLSVACVALCLPVAAGVVVYFFVQ
ncbi:hypothetical protein [Streptomyces olivochromogenes]|uniref:Uncharacterized protein n=1 Tax=Streptomyces olivochromogenes TaxID=1963 RepID=A0A250VV18_STROL|nr:hypothetical protein [Streptomyces olivochromogenes]KUN42468.1 hypothetical protein AQJ27_36715 [Streptomyces olivochromogenes]GAX57954.1 hypothetical protein SO3561_09525 [Streptomyces olivochromogenes]